MPLITDWIIASITLLYSLITIGILLSSKKSNEEAKIQLDISEKQLKEMIAQQKQNVGIQLYDKRMAVLKRFTQKEYEEILWDVSILFQDNNEDYDFFRKIQMIGIQEAKLKGIQDDILMFAQYLIKNEGGRVYLEYEKLSQEKMRPQATEEDAERLYSFCDQYIYTYKDETSNKMKTLNFRELEKSAQELCLRNDATHAVIFMKLMDYIATSIEKGS